MNLSNALKSITAVSNATATTTEPTYQVSYMDTTDHDVINPGDGEGLLTGTAAVTIIAAPPNGSKLREVTGISIYNGDTVSHTITVKKVSTSTGYTLAAYALSAGESLVYTKESGWSVLTAATFGAGTIVSGASNGATVGAVETMVGLVHHTKLTFTATPITMRDTEQGGGVKVYDFPNGRIAILGASASIAVTTTAETTTLNAGVTCNWGIGSTTQASATVATTEQDIVNVTAFVASATKDVAGATAVGYGAATAIASPLDAYLNLAVAGASDIDGNATVTVTGTANIFWINLGLGV